MVVAVSPRSFRQVPGRHQSLLEEAGFEIRYPQVDRNLSEEEMINLVQGCEGLIVGIDPVSAPVLAAGPLRVVAKFGSGLDNIDLEAAAALNVKVSATPGANSQAVAELTIALLFALARHVVIHHRAAEAGIWERRMGVELKGRRLGIVGLGEIGYRVGRMASGIGMEVVSCDPHLEKAEFPLLSLDELISTSDVVSLHAPLTAETEGMIGPLELSSMKPGSLLINTARGGLVDEQALANALISGHLAGSACDDFVVRPGSDSPLWDCPGFLASPHAGAATVEAVERTGMAAVELVLEELT